MIEDKGIMRFETVLPADFDGIFRFTNWTDREFVGIWGGKEYHFPALATSPIIIPDHSPLQIQYIRKKFAKDLAEREYYRSTAYENLRRVEGEIDQFTGVVKPTLNSIQQANSYTINDLAPYIQKCLDPLPVSAAAVVEVPKLDMEDILSKDPKDGKLNTAPAESEADLENLARGRASLKQKAGV